ncbi:hypothetical protein GTA08_BOTSDO07514 [Botryosphaeria dothidea]|uniref:Uncharacterized protein n=1 Tax=Botryosphaeria dothidea TaxID=55169 RepID=A0A8H4INR8_9PEZI|nr:hypothetical protein GTA08_BOTSDO07514 [Botryosphaeria dothidea]
MHFFSTELLCLASVLLIPASAAPTSTAEEMVPVHFARNLLDAAHNSVDKHNSQLVRRTCTGAYENYLQCYNSEAARCLHCSSEKPKESLTCLNSCFSEVTEFCGKLCPAKNGSV